MDTHIPLSLPSLPTVRNGHKVFFSFVALFRSCIQLAYGHLFSIATLLTNHLEPVLPPPPPVWMNHLNHFIFFLLDLLYDHLLFQPSFSFFCWFFVFLSRQMFLEPPPLLCPIACTLPVSAKQSEQIIVIVRRLISKTD